ncbi:MAG TPA: AMP-binding protein [Chitinivibrionales bacterium]|nr:AMP-binding protein [Chitinivibrionales bacterium]
MAEKIGYYTGAHVKNNVFSFLEKHLTERPGFTVLRWVARPTLEKWAALPECPLVHDAITLEPFVDGIRRVAAGFLELGLHAGDRVILFLPMSVPMYTAMSALQMIGAVPVFLDSWARRGQLGVAVQIAQARGMISFEQAFDFCEGDPVLAALPLRIVFGPAKKQYAAGLEQLFAAPRRAAPVPVEQEHTALITFTTGSSGKPKGANRTHRFLAAQHYAIDAGMPYAASDVDLPLFPIFSLNNIAAGVSTVLPAIDAGTPGENDAAVLLAQIQACGVTCMTLNPWLLSEISSFCQGRGISLQSIRRVVAGGAAVSRDQVKRLVAVAPSAEMWVLYGSTEVEPIAHIEAKDMLSFEGGAAADPELVDDGVNVGHLVSGLSAKFLTITKGPITISTQEDWKLLEVPAGTVGELAVSGEHVCRDYVNDEEAFTRSKIRDERGTIWHRTGDLARIDAKGYLWLVGRVHNVIQRGATFVFPVRAEIALKKLPFVVKCAFLGLPDPVLGERCICVIVPTDASAVGDAAKEARMAAEVERVMRKNSMPVDAVMFRKAIPMDPRHHSKVEYEVLKQEILHEQ